MNNGRVISIGMKTSVYHHPQCRYVHRMKYKNRLSLPLQEMRKYGLRPCRCCNTMNYHYISSERALKSFEKKRGMEFRYLDEALYIKTELGCWKIVYLEEKEMFRLFHRNTTNKPLDFDHPQYETYHPQKDKKYSNSIEGYLYYIYEHDRYKSTVLSGEKVTNFSSKKYQKREAKAERKRAAKTVDRLFAMLERQNSEYKQFSIC